MTSVVELLGDDADYGDAPSFIATGVSRMFLISPNILRITFVRFDRRHDGAREQRVSGHIDCDVGQLPAILDVLRQGLGALVEQPIDPRGPARGSVNAH